MPHKARDHYQNRKRVCILCMAKADGDITELVLERIHKYIPSLEHCDIMDPRFPKAICGSCRNTLGDISKGDKDSSVLPRPYNYVTLMHNFTGDSTTCKCFICQVARQTPQTNKLCIPLSTKRRGNPNFIKDKYKIGKISDNQTDINVINQLPSTSSTVLSAPRKSLNSNDMKEIRTTVGLSYRQTRKLSQIVRSKLGRTSIEPNIDLTLDQEKSIFQEVIYHESMNMDVKETKEKRSIVLCNNVENIVWELKEKRDLDTYNHLVKIGIDGGQGFLKVCMIVTIFNQEDQKSSLNDVSLDSVKKIIILSLAENVKETYDNLKIMLSPMKLHKIKFYCSVDLKVASVVIGIQNAAATYPCIYCEKSKNQFGNRQEKTNDEENEPSNELNSESKSNFYFFKNDFTQ